MAQLLSSTVVMAAFVVGLVLYLTWPLLLVWLIYRFARDLRRIASALERMEERQVHGLGPAPLQAVDSPLEILAGRPVVNSMFGR